MSNDAEKDLDEYLAALPAYKRKEFEQGLSSLSQEEMNQWADVYLSEGPERFAKLRQEAELSEEFERLLLRVPARLKTYRKREMLETQRPIASLLPKGHPGRKQNVALAERIWALNGQGKSNREIQETLKTEGESRSLEAVESYLKARRRPRKK